MACCSTNQPAMDVQPRFPATRMAAIYQPKPADVLCGRGKRSFGHEGNYFFRQLVVEHASIYKTAPTKKQKTQVVMLVAKTIIARGGRFLIPHDTSCDGNACWKDGGLKHGKRKAGHALCDALRGRMSFVQLRKAQLRTDAELRATTAQQAQDQHIAQQNTGFPLESVTSSGFSVPQTYSTVEPSNQWMTARMDAELANYLRNLFLLSKGTK